MRPQVDFLALQTHKGILHTYIPNHLGMIGIGFWVGSQSSLIEYEAHILIWGITQENIEVHKIVIML